MSDWSSDVCSSDLLASGIAAKDFDFDSFVRLNHDVLTDVGRHDYSASIEAGNLISRHQSGSCGRGTCYDIRNNWPSGWIAIGICNHREDKGSEQEIYHGAGCDDNCALRSEEHTSELQSLMRISYAVFCL